MFSYNIRSMKFTKVERGWYATADGTYAVVVDGFSPSKSNGAGDGDYEGFQGNEWGLAYDRNGQLREDHNAGQNVDWFTTKGAAVKAAERHAEGLTVLRP